MLEDDYEEGDDDPGKDGEFLQASSPSPAISSVAFPTVSLITMVRSDRVIPIVGR